MNEWIGVREAAHINGVTKAAIYLAIKKNRLKAIKKDRWILHLKDVEFYKMDKYSRENFKVNGKKVFDNEKGLYSANQASQLLGISPQKVYYALRMGYLKSHKMNASWVINIEDIRKYKEILKEVLKYGKCCVHNYLIKRGLNEQKA